MGLTERKRFKKIKQCVIDRDGLTCCYCNLKLDESNVTMEHIVPYSKNGTFNTTNLTVSCSTCNNKRGNINFFTYCKKINLSKDKLKKYKKMYFNNLKIKILNVSKEHIIKDFAIPNDLINETCNILKIKEMDFSYYNNIINFEKIADKKDIKRSFQKIIKELETDI